MDTAISVEGVPIRLTHERWFHIVENHDDMAGYFLILFFKVIEAHWSPREAMDASAI